MIQVNAILDASVSDAAVALPEKSWGNVAAPQRAAS
jgi:hypothetical protein